MQRTSRTFSNHLNQGWIRVARPEDAPSIYSLKVAAFASSSLPFSIYRSPKSIRYIRHLIEKSVTGSPWLFRVFEQNHQVRAYYHALLGEDACFLNYLAVDAPLRGKGIGHALVLNFENEARLKSYDRTMLDTYRRLSDTLVWYKGHGYREISSSYSLRIMLADIEPGQSTISWNQTDWSRAVAMELENGFSKVTVFYQKTPLELGLIDGNAFKLLSYPCCDIAAIVAAIARSFAGLRNELIISSLPYKPIQWPIYQCEESVRMLRNLSPINKKDQNDTTQPQCIL